jgi:hypothetical protein
MNFNLWVELVVSIHHIAFSNVLKIFIDYYFLVEAILLFVY